MKIHSPKALPRADIYVREGGVYVSGQVDMATYPKLANKLKTLANPQTWQVDFSQMESCDSTGVLLLLNLERRANEVNEKLQLVGVPDAFQQLLDLYRVCEFFSCKAPLASSPISS